MALSQYLVKHHLPLALLAWSLLAITSTIGVEQSVNDIADPQTVMGIVAEFPEAKAGNGVLSVTIG